MSSLHGNPYEYHAENGVTKNPAATYATLALAYEQRTANLIDWYIAARRDCADDLRDRTRGEIIFRLGLGEPTS